MLTKKKQQQQQKKNPIKQLLAFNGGWLLGSGRIRLLEQSVKVVFPWTSRSNLHTFFDLRLFGGLSPIVWLALTLAALSVYLIVYKMKHFVLYIVNLLHSVS